MIVNRSFRTISRLIVALALATLLASSAFAPAQDSAATAKAPAGTISDAQVQANVLKALAGASDLANQSITTSTVFGTVTLSGAVQTEAQRTEAENLAARASGVKKVVDELTLSADAVNTQPADTTAAQGSAPDPNDQPQQAYASVPPPPPAQQQSPAPIEQAAPESNPQSPNQAAGPDYGPGAPEYRQPYNPQRGAPPDYSQAGPGQNPDQGPPNAQQYPSQPGYPQGSPDARQYPPPPPGYPPYPQRPGYAQQPSPNSYPGAAYTGQPGGQTVTIPAGAQLQVRINQTLDSSHATPGQRFDGVVINDIAAGNLIAIPRGAMVHGTVVDAKSSGALKGRGELSLQLNSINLGGREYPIVSDVWAHNGNDKTVESVDKTILGGALGALVGAAAGGGQGAAIGAGVGGALGLGSSAASHNGQVFVPSEGLLTFHLAQPSTVATVSQAEMNRLAQSAGPGTGPPVLRRRGYYAYPPPPPYYGPRYPYRY